MLHSVQQSQPRVENACCVCRCFQVIADFFKKVGVLTAIAFTASVLVGAFYSIPIALTIFGGYVLVKSIYHLVKPKAVAMALVVAPQVVAVPLVVSETVQFAPTQVHLPEIHPNKLHVYSRLVTRRGFQQASTYTKGTLRNVDAVYNMPLPRPIMIDVRRGTFQYDPSDDRTMHWTANFADELIFGFSHTPLLAQDELQVAEHPALAHYRLEMRRRGASPNWGFLTDDEALLVENVERMGRLNMYGNGFATATTQEIDAHLERFEEPQVNNLFAMAAPDARRRTSGALYEREDLEQYFNRSYAAFQMIKERHPNKNIVVHTGNWGAGAFGNSPKVAALMQLVAARLAEVQLIYYPRIHIIDFLAAEEVYSQISLAHPDWTMRQFMDHIFEHRARYNLFYGVGNGT